MVTQNINLDGTTAFSAFGSSYTWSGQRIEAVYIGIGSGATTNTLNATLSGPAWTFKTLSLYNDTAFGFNTTLTDTNDGISRRIDRIQLQDTGNATITLFDTRVRHIEGGNASNVTLNLGSQTIESIALGDGNDSISFGSGGANYVNLGNGANVVNGAGGFMNYLQFGNGTNTFNGGAGNFGTIRADGNNTISLLTGGDSIIFGNGNNIVTMQDGFLGALTAYSETFSFNNITIGANAFVRSISLNQGTDRVTVNGQVEEAHVGAGKNTTIVGAFGDIGSLLGAAGVDILTVNGGHIAQANMGDGNNVITLNSGQIDALTLGNGDDRITVKAGQINMLWMGSGNNTAVLGSQFVHFIKGFEGDDTVTVGTGGAGAIKLDSGNNTIITGVTGTGDVESILTFDGVDHITIGAYAGTIRTNGGNDILNLINGSADFIDAGDGNDTVTLGTNVARFVVLGNGDDTISLGTMNPDYGVLIQGDSGSDTLDLSRFANGVTLSLNLSGAWQDFGLVGAGFISVIGVENLIGTGLSDSLEGNSSANTLTGGLGADSLSGLDGDDRLIGGKGADILTGGLGLDTFVFAAGDGSDRIKDFTLGDDHITIAGTHALADITFARVGADVRLTVGTLQVLVEHMTVAALHDATNFVF